MEHAQMSDYDSTVLRTNFGMLTANGDTSG